VSILAIQLNHHLELDDKTTGCHVLLPPPPLLAHKLMPLEGPLHGGLNAMVMILIAEKKTRPTNKELR